MYFNKELFTFHFNQSLEQHTLESVSKKIEVPMFSLSRFQVGLVENETIIDYYKVCKWMNQEPVMYVVDMSKLLPIPEGIITNDEYARIIDGEELSEFKSRVIEVSSKGVSPVVFRQERKPILVISLPMSVPIAQSVQIGRSEYVIEIKKDYYVLIVNRSVDEPEFELLSLENIDEIKYEELKEMINKTYQTVLKDESREN